MKTIKSKADFEKVFTRGTRGGSALVRVRALAACEGHDGRVAFVAPKRLGNAVYRNRCKRVLREAARSCGLPQEGTDIILFATQDTHDAPYDQIVSALAHALRKAGV